MVDFKNLSQEERAILNANFLKPRDELERLILEYRKKHGISTPDDIASKQAKEERKQEVRQTVDDIVDASMQNLNIKELDTKDICKTAEKIMQDVEKRVNAVINNASDDPERLQALAESLGCKRLYTKAYKDDATDEDMRAFATALHSKVYPDGIRESIKQAIQYSNNGEVISGENTQGIMNALNNNLCLILQLSTKGNVTGFICTNNYAVIQNLYGSEYYYAAMAYAVKHAIINAQKGIAPRDSAPLSQNLHRVLSGSLRIKQIGKDTYDLSSTTYTWNEDRTVACIILDNPSTIGNQLQNSFEKIDKIPKYQLVFDMDIFTAIARNPIYNTMEDQLKVLSDVESFELGLDHFIRIYKLWQKIKNTGKLSNF